MTVYRKTSSLHYRPTLIINATVDICSNMSNELTSPILMMFMDDVKDHGNVFHPCPYTVFSCYFFREGCVSIEPFHLLFVQFQGHNFIKNHTMQIGALPPIIPGGEYHIKYYFYTIWKGSDHVAFQIHSYFDVVPRGIERFWLLMTYVRMRIGRWMRKMVHWILQNREMNWFLLAFHCIWK